MLFIHSFEQGRKTICFSFNYMITAVNYSLKFSIAVIEAQVNVIQLQQKRT